MKEQPVAARERTFLFSVVTAMYNVAQWLDAFFASLENQTLGLREHIEIIVVDDGSTDASADIAKRWAQKYPENIFYHYKQNGGPASARNLGLDYARGEWVTFIDPDDAVDAQYFEKVSLFLQDFSGVAVCCNILYMDADTKQLRNAHPLRYKFQNGPRQISLLEHEEYIQLSAASACIRVDAVKRANIRFEERIKPTFEDAHFLNLLLLHENNYTIGILPEAAYLYRQSSNQGLVATSWNRREKYSNQIFYGYRNLLQSYKQKLQNLPGFIQNTVIYDLHGYLERMADNRIPFAFDAQTLAVFWDAFAAVLAYLDPKQILLGNLPSVPLRTRVMLLTLQSASFNAAPCMLLELNTMADQARLLHWAADPQKLYLEEGSGRRTLLAGKHITLEFHGRRLCCGQYVWIPLGHGDGNRVALEDGTPLLVTCGNAVFESLKQREIRRRLLAPATALPEPLRELHRQARGQEAARQYGGCWLVMDRVHKADDNAEHFYRWLREQPDFTRPLYFVLDPASSDWERLRTDGFTLLPHGSNRHALAAFLAEWLISSNMENRVFDPFGTKFLYGLPRYKFAYLQHGVTQNDLSAYMNNAPIDMMVAAVQREYDFLSGGRYKFTRRELALTGFPRHDALLARANERPARRRIVFCPTWRQHLYGTEAHIPGLDPKEATRFAASDYFQAWNAVTGSKRLARSARQHGYELLFFPHPLTSRFVPLYANAGAFTFASYSDVASVQDILLDAALMVTDYSSIAMDVALIGRPVAYYQFRENPAFFDSHLCARGYFEYPRDGFGPVLPDLDSLIDFLEAQMRGGCKREPLYTERAEEFFTLRDGQNCRRTYEAILKRS